MTRYADRAGAARLLPALGQSGRPAAAAPLRRRRRRASGPLRRDLHRPAARPTSGRTWASTRRAAASTCREADCRRHGVDPLELLAGKDSAAVHRPRRRARRLGARADAAGRAAGPRGAGPRRLGVAPGGPGRAAHPRENRPRSTARPCAAPEARLAPTRRRSPGAPWRCAARRSRRARAPREGRRPPGRAAMTPEQYVQDKAAASGSSFYYAFLFLPPPRRAAITAFYAFCREVDDVVDEVSDPGVAAAKLAWWRSEVAARFGRQAEPSGDAGADAAHRRLRHRAAAPAGGDRRLPDGPRPDRATSTSPAWRATATWSPASSARSRPTSSAARARRPSPMRTGSAWRCSSPTSSATSATTRAAAASTCRWTS